MIKTVTCDELPNHNTFFWPSPEQKNLLDYYDGIKPIQFLDLGCGTPLHGILLHHSIGIHSFTGYDTNLDISRLKYAKETYAFHNDLTVWDQVQTEYDFYKTALGLLKTESTTLLTDEEYNHFFSRKIRMSGVLNFCDHNDKYNFIHSQFLLHFHELHSNLDSIIWKIKEALMEDGLLILRVKREQEDFDYDHFKTVIKEHFKTGVFYEANDENRQALFINKHGLIDID